MMCTPRAMLKQSRHYCGTCRKKTGFVVDKYGPLACLIFFPLLFVNAFRKPRCQVCGSQYWPLARIKALHH